jgi:hypothetical protein
MLQPGGSIVVPAVMFGSCCQVLVDTSNFPGWRAAGTPALARLAAEALAVEVATRLTGPATAQWPQ